MWKKINKRTWIKDSGEIISNESYARRGLIHKHIYLYLNQFDFDKGMLYKDFKTVNAAKKYIA